MLQFFTSNFDFTFYTKFNHKTFTFYNFHIKYVVFIKSRNSKDLITLKIFGYSNFKIFFILALTSFIFGWLVLFAINPVTSTMMKYYDKQNLNILVT